MYMDEGTFDEWVKGRTCTSCAIIRKDILAFTLGWSNQEDIESSDITEFYLIHYLPNAQGEPRRNDFGIQFKGDTRRRFAVNHRNPELLCVALGGNVLYQSSGSGKNEKMIPSKLMKGVSAVKFIGNHFYIAGGTRSVLRRDGVDQWTDMTPGLRVDGPLDMTAHMGFSDIDGFSESEIYAVGGDGDVWRFDGSRWLQEDLPTNESTTSVCCGADGMVYIGGRNHLIVKGRQGCWDIHHQDDSGRWFDQIIDYQGHILTVDEWGSILFEITDTGIQPFDTGSFSIRPASCLHLAVGQGMLLTAGDESANLFDGQTWRSVFHPSANDEAVAYDLFLKTQETLEQLNQRLEDLNP